MDRNVDESDDIEGIVQDTNVQMEIENKLLSDLMKSLECENQQGKDEEVVQGREKIKAKDVPVCEPARSCEASKSCERDRSGLESGEIPLIVIETEYEWKRRECNEKTPGKRDEIPSPGETTRQEKQETKREDFEFEINMEQFQKELSDVVKDDANTKARGTRSTDIFSSILEELDSHIEKKAFGPLSEEKTDKNEEEFQSVLRASEEGQCCGAASEVEIACDTSKYLPDILDNMSVNAQESCLDPQLMSTITDESVLDSLTLIESTRTSDLEGASYQRLQETPSNSPPRYQEHFTKTESAFPGDLVNHAIQLSNKPNCFDETNNDTINPPGQNAEISFISDDIFEIKCTNDIISRETLQGGPKDAFPLPLDGDSVKTYTKNIQPKVFQEVMDNVDVRSGSLSGILSRNDVGDKESVDLGADLGGGSLQERVKLPISSSNGGDDRTEYDLLEHQKILADEEDDDESRMTMSRKGELYVVTNIGRNSFAASEPLEAVERNEPEWEDRLEETFQVDTEEKNLISFDDNDVLVTSRDLPLATALTMSNRGEHGRIRHCIDLLAEDREGTSSVSENIILLMENKSNGESLGLNEMENVKRDEGEVEREQERDLPSFPVVGTLVEISPHCTKPSHEAAGILLRPFENTSVIINSCKDHILSETSTCTDMNLSEEGKTTISSKDVDAGDGKQTEDTLEENMNEKQETDTNEDVLSCRNSADNSCGYDRFQPDLGKDSAAQSHDIQAIIEISCFQKNEEFAEKKPESSVCGSTKRQREQDADIEEGLKKLKINDSFDEKQSTNDLRTIRDSPASRNSKNKEEKTQGTESLKCENIVQTMDGECYLNSMENRPASETCVIENNLLTSQELDSKDEQEQGKVVVNLEENYRFRTLKSTSGTEKLVVTAQQDITHDKLIELESFIEMSLNDSLNDSLNPENVEETSIPCCYGDADNKSNENTVKKYGPGKMLLENERAEDGNGDKVERDMTNFQHDTKQLQLVPNQDCSTTKSVEQASASCEDSVSVLSENLNKILIGEEEIQTDNEKTSGEEPLEQISTDSNGDVDVTLDEVTRVTQGTGLNAHIHPESRREFEESVTQEAEQLKIDITVKDMQATEQEEQIHKEGQSTEPEEGDVMQEEESVAQVTIATQCAEKKEQKFRLETIQECCEKLEELETVEILTQNVTQDVLPAETSSQVEKPVDQSVTQDDTRDSKKRIAEAENYGKGIEEVTLEEKQAEAEVQVAQPEEVTQQFAEEITPEHKDDTKELKIAKKVTQEEEPVTQLQEKEKVVLGVQEDVNALKQLLREVTQPEVEGDVTQEIEENSQEEVDGVITRRQREKNEKEQNEEGRGGRKREQLEEETLEVKGEYERKEEVVNQLSTDKQLEMKAQRSGINFDSQGNQIKFTETKMKIALKEEEEHDVHDKSSKTGRKENEMASAQESDKDEDKENRIRSFEMLVHLETILKEIDMYRREQKKLRDSFKTCMNEIMNNLSSMTKAVQLMETRLNHKIKDAHDELKKCCGNLESNRDTILSMDTLLRSYSVTQNQFGDLRQRVKDLEIICRALNISEIQDEITYKVSAEIDAMDRRVRVTENDVSDLKLRVTELEAECSSLRKLSPAEEELEIQAGRREIKLGRANAPGRTRENLNEELVSSPVIGRGQRYYGLYSEEV